MGTIVMNLNVKIVEFLKTCFDLLAVLTFKDLRIWIQVGLRVIVMDWQHTIIQPGCNFF